jgi:hypothetical protein
LNALAAEDVFIVTGSGNANGAPVDGYPALYRDPSSSVQVPDLLVVGAVDNTGLVWLKSQPAAGNVYVGSYVEVYAPGVDISCANSAGGSKLAFGTSLGEIPSLLLIAIIKIYLQSDCNCCRASCILKRPSRLWVLYRCFFEGRNNRPSMGKTFV